jgi:hypothetical protein
MYTTSKHVSWDVNVEKTTWVVLMLFPIKTILFWMSLTYFFSQIIFQIIDLVDTDKRCKWFENEMK